MGVRWCSQRNRGEEEMQVDLRVRNSVVKLESFVKCMSPLIKVPASVLPEQTKSYSLYLWNESTRARSCQIAMEQAHSFKQWCSRVQERMTIS